MKLISLSIFLTLLISFTSAWSDEDYEIFTLREAVENDLGKGVTFYDWFNIPQNARDDDIAKAYRKLSRQLHPDKNAHHTATDKYARLSLVNNILRSELRERYDFFLNKGFPTWKGTDYYYKRYRPGLGTVLVFLYLFISAAQYTLLKIGKDRDRSHMSGIIDEARSAAWGGSSNVATKRKVTLPNGKLFVVYPEGTVYLLDQDVEYILDLNEIQPARWKDTILFKLPIWLMGLFKKSEAQPQPKSRLLQPDNSSASSAARKKRSSPRPTTPRPRSRQ